MTLLLIIYQHDAIASNKCRLTHANGVADDPDGEVGAVLPQPRRGELRVLRPEDSHCSFISSCLSEKCRAS